MTDLRCASGVVRRPTALGPEAAHLGLDKRLARASERGAERAHELERRGRPGPLATATIHAPHGLEASAVRRRVVKPELSAGGAARRTKREPELQ